jgi:hypothetical protein
VSDEEQRIESEENAEVEAHKRRVLANEDLKADDDESDDVEAHRRRG